MGRSGEPTTTQATAHAAPDSASPAATAAEPARPAAQPPEPERDHADGRRFSMDGVEWVAWVSGTGAAGTGSRGLGLVEAVHFAPAANGDRRQHREALIARGRFSNLFDQELLSLFRAATPIDASRPAAKNGQRNGRRR